MPSTHSPPQSNSTWWGHHINGNIREKSFLHHAQCFAYHIHLWTCDPIRWGYIPSMWNESIWSELSKYPNSCIYLTKRITNKIQNQTQWLLQIRIITNGVSEGMPWIKALDRLFAYLGNMYSSDLKSQILHMNIWEVFHKIWHIRVISFVDSHPLAGRRDPSPPTPTLPPSCHHLLVVRFRS